MKKKPITLIFMLLIMFQVSNLFIETEASNNISTNLKWRKISSYNYGEASFFDYDKDGKLDVFFKTAEGIEIYNHKGILLKKIYGYFQYTPTITDLEKNGDLEFITPNYYGIEIYDSTGQLKEQNLTLYSAYARIVVADINNDGIQEIIYHSTGDIICFNNQLEEIWSYKFENPDYYGSIYDLVINSDADSEKEIVVYYDNSIYLFDTNGEKKWSKSLSSEGIIAYDFNDDGIDEIIGTKSADYTIYSLNSEDGSELWINEMAVNLNPLPIDLDQDGTVELIALSTDKDKSESYINYINGETGEVEEQITVDYSFFSNSYYEFFPEIPAVGDFDGNGVLDLIFFAFSYAYSTATLIYSADGYRIAEFDEGTLTTPTIVDLDGNGRTEIMIRDYSGMFCYEVTGLTSGKNIWYKERGNIANTMVTDSDGDLLDDLNEEFYGSDKSKEDTDGDTLLDGVEIIGSGSSPIKQDTDGDGLTDDVEYELGFNPRLNDLDLDYDDDSLTNYDEVFVYSTNPMSNDTDNDLLLDNEEINTY
ncbi:MAG: hypothetical protein ACTSPP_09635, partial [Candidatus Heimdallarchaeaceae archaeon]